VWRLTGLEEEVAFIAAWIDAGCPRDDIAVESACRVTLYVSEARVTPGTGVREGAFHKPNYMGQL
jgi:hypothetical protein